MPDICPFCGEDLLIDVIEYFPEDRSFLLDTCCEELQNFVLSEIPDWPSKECIPFFWNAIGERIQHVVPDVDRLVLDYGLELIPVSFAEAQAFIREHHRHNVPPRGWKFGASLMNGPDLVAVMTAGRPVARLLDDGKTLEVTRLCVRHDLWPHKLVFNACSKLYSHACDRAQELGYAKVITYTLESEMGTSPKAANFVAVAKTKGGSWNTPSRERQDKAPTCRKIRWERRLNGSRKQDRNNHALHDHLGAIADPGCGVVG
jgi:hypothetical protein